MSDEYEEQAKKFLKDTNTTFKAVFVEHNKHFVDDKDKRDIYEISLKRGEREFKFRFGNSINASGEYIFFGDNGKERIYLKRNKDNKPIKRYNGVHLNNGNSTKNKGFKEPTAYDILACLTKYEVGEFKDFCATNYGYNDDSIKAEKVYKAVLKEWDNVRMLWSDKEIEQLQEIQ